MTVSVRVVRLRLAITKVELARRLGRTKGFVTQILAGNQNLTLRTIADVTDALGHRVDVGVGAASGWQVSIDVPRNDNLEPLAPAANDLTFVPRFRDSVGHPSSTGGR